MSDAQLLRGSSGFFSFSMDIFRPNPEIFLIILFALSIYLNNDFYIKR